MGLSLLFITHDLGVVAGISDRVLVMQEGRIVEGGSTDQIYYAPKHPYTKQLFAACKAKKKIHKTRTGPLLLALQGLCKKYPIGKRELTAVSAIDLSLFKGETLALVGESGCGKSTVGKLAAGLLQPTNGVVLYEGKILQQIRAFRRKIQILFQNPYGSLNPHMRVETILKEPFEIHRDLKKQDLGALLEQVGLSSDYLKRYPHQLSGGQRQRVALARALAVEPEFLVLDEPLSALDATSQQQILELLKRLKKERQLTYLFISHDLETVKSFADRIAVMYLGELVELLEGQTPSHPYTQALFSAICHPNPREERKRQRILLSGDLPSPMARPAGCAFQKRCPHAQELCRTTPPPLIQMGEGHVARCHFPSEG